MKFFCIIVFLLPGALLAQDCKLKKTVDPYTREVRLSTGLISLGGTSVSIEADSKEIDFFFTMTRSESCFDGSSTAVVTYEGTRAKATFKNGGTTNCQGFFHIIFKNQATTPTLLQRLISQKITSILLTGTGTSKTNVEFSQDDQQKIMLMGECLVKEAKTLIKPAM